MRSTAEVVGPETLPVGSESLVLEDLHEAIPQVLVGHLSSDGISLHVHHAVLHEIEGQGSESTAESRDGGGEKVGAETLSESLIEELLGLIVGGHHSEVHGHGTEDHGKATSPQSPETLLLGDTNQGSEAVAVTTALLRGEQTIGLHAHHGNIERVTDHTGKGSRGQRRHSGGEEGDGTSIALLQVVGEHTVETETGSSVNGLSHQRGGETSIQLHHSLLLNELLGNSHSSHVGGLADQLDTSLNQINRLDLDVTSWHQNVQWQKQNKRRCIRTRRAGELSCSSGSLYNDACVVEIAYC